VFTQPSSLCYSSAGIHLLTCADPNCRATTRVAGTLNGRPISPYFEKGQYSSATMNGMVIKVGRSFRSSPCIAHIHWALVRP
jgi:hypothetical protein